MSSRPTVAVIDCDAFVNNLREIRKRIGPERKVMAVVKANAYGHGAVQLARCAIGTEADWLAVATIEEANELKDSGIDAPILILGAILPQEAKEVVKRGFRAVVPSHEVAQALEKASRTLGTKAKVHIMLDTGMGRIGFWHEGFVEDFQRIQSLGNLQIEGVLSHFRQSDVEDKEFAEWQLTRFREITNQIQKRGHVFQMRHIANSGAILDYPDSFFDMVRAGIILYGLYPSAGASRNLSLGPVMTLKTKVVFLKTAPPGRSISYGRTYTTNRVTRVATLPLGYADGIPRYLSNTGFMMMKGIRVPIIGRVTMDQTMIDVTEVSDVALGDDVLVFGRMGEDSLSVEEVARWAGTIPYEVVCWVSRRVPRDYVRRDIQSNSVADREVDS